MATRSRAQPNPTRPKAKETRHWMSDEDCQRILGALDRAYRRRGPLPFQLALTTVQTRASRRFSRATIYRLLGTHGWRPAPRWIRTTVDAQGKATKEVRSPESIVLQYLEEPGTRISVSTLYRRLHSLGWIREVLWVPVGGEAIPS